MPRPKRRVPELSRSVRIVVTDAAATTLWLAHEPGSAAARSIDKAIATTGTGLDTDQPPTAGR